MFCKKFPLSRGTLSPQKALDLANIHLENARKTKDVEIRLALCDDADAALSRIKKPSKKAFTSLPHVTDDTLRLAIAAAYLEHGKLLDILEHVELAQISYKKAEKWGHVQETDQLSPDGSRLSNRKDVFSLRRSLVPAAALSAASRLSSPSGPSSSQGRDFANIPQGIFDQNVTPAIVKYDLPDTHARLASTPQLVYCLSLLPSSSLRAEQLDETERAWSQARVNDEDEQERLRTLAVGLTVAFINDVLKSPSIVAEVICLAPALDQQHFKRLVMTFIDGINHATMLESHLLDGLARLMQRASPGYLNTDDLVRILEVLSRRLKDTHKQSTQYAYKLTLAVSHILDAMADCNFKGLNRVKLHEPLFDYLNGLKSSSDPYLVYQSAYAFQALQYVPDDESPVQATLRHARIVAKGVSGIMSAVKAFDIIEGLEHIQDVVVELSKVAKIGYDAAKALAESGQDFFDCLSEGLSFAKKRTWYPALRSIDDFIRHGQLAEVKKLICEAPHRRDIAFQWGVCQRLGEIAANPAWSSNIRRGAIDFLGELYKNDVEWDPQTIIKQWILTILKQLASQSGGTSQSAETLLNELGVDEDIKKQGLYKAFREEPQHQYPLEIAFPPLASPSLLDRVQNKPDIEASLYQLRERRLKEQGGDVYIPPQAKPSLQAPDDVLFPLTEKVNDFLSRDPDQKVMLLLGDSGSGKSTFNRALERNLWNAYKKKDGRIPLFINLPAIDKPEQDLIIKHLRRAEFTDLQIKEMRSYRRFVLICDGYDESQQTHNLYTSNRLNQPGEWNAQMVISCRSESLGLDYRDRFQPSDRNIPATPEFFQEAVIAPFSLDQVQDYIKQYVSTVGTLWQVTDYLQVLRSIPSLQELARNPFMLTLTMEVLPRMVVPGQDLTSVQVTRVALYDQFVEQWLERGKRRLGDKDLSHQEKKVFESLSDEGFAQNGVAFLKKLAVAIYEEQAGNPVVEYSHFRDQGTWKENFFSREDEKQLLREACPLTRSGNQYRFIHKSLLEYCLARAVFEPQDGENARRAAPPQALLRRGSVHSVLTFESQAAEETVVAIEQAVLNSPLARKSFVSESTIVQLLAERVQQEPLFKQQLLAVIELSKVDKEARKAASNAVTILVRAGISFNGADLRGIQIPGADLSGGKLDSAQLQGADLRKVNLRNIWLRQADLSNAKMTGVEFGEWPYLQEDGEVYSCTYSPDGRAFAIGLDNGTIIVYNTATWVKIHLLHGHTAVVYSVTYSPDSQQIASCSQDETVRLWDAQTGVPGPVLRGHSNRIVSVAYSPSGLQIASGSWDSTVRLWDTQTGAPGLILRGHENLILCVTYSPSGHQIATGGQDNTVRLWDALTGVTTRILNDHTSHVLSVKYSPSGLHIASGSRDTTVRVWDAKTGAAGPVLIGHTAGVTSVAYSPSGLQIASGSDDNTVRLWDMPTGVPGPILHGHTYGIICVTYSPSGLQIASGGSDRTVRLWDAQSSSSDPVLNDHSYKIYGVAYSSSNHHVASGGSDNIVRLWDAQTGASGPILRGHAKRIWSVAFSPDGLEIASGSADETVRLWDAKTGEHGLILRGHTGDVASVAYSPKGLQIATGSWDRTVRVWDIQTGTTSLILSGHTGSVKSIAYSPSGLQIASGGQDSTVRLWDTQTGTVSHILRGHSGSITSVTYSLGGRQVASGSWDNEVRLWDAQTGTPGPVLSGHADWINSIVYSPNDRLIASGSSDHTVRLWDVDSGRLIAVVNDFHGNTTSLAWNNTPGSNNFATGSADIICVWEVTEEEGHFQVRLNWGSMHDRLSVSNTSVQYAEDLSRINKLLLKQRGAVDETILPLSFNETNKNIASMAPVCPAPQLCAGPAMPALPASSVPAPALPLIGPTMPALLASSAPAPTLPLIGPTMPALLASSAPAPALPLIGPTMPS